MVVMKTFLSLLITRYAELSSRRPSARAHLLLRAPHLQAYVQNVTSLQILFIGILEETPQENRTFLALH